MSNLINDSRCTVCTHRAHCAEDSALSSTVLRTVRTVLNWAPLYLEPSTVLRAQRKSQICHLINQTQLNFIFNSTLSTPKSTLYTVLSAGYLEISEP